MKTPQNRAFIATPEGQKDLAVSLRAMANMLESGKFKLHRGGLIVNDKSTPVLLCKHEASYQLEVDASFVLIPAG